MGKFKVGDFVEAFGIQGVVETVNRKSHQVEVRIASGVAPTGSLIGFTEDGRLWEWHREPSLKLIHRPKKKVKKWVNLYDYNRTSQDVFGTFYDSLEKANAMATASRIACVEIEVEED